MRALGALPVAGPDQQLAVFFALLAMELVNRHKQTLSNPRHNSSSGDGPATLEKPTSSLAKGEVWVIFPELVPSSWISAMGHAEVGIWESYHNAFAYENAFLPYRSVLAGVTRFSARCRRRRFS